MIALQSFSDTMTMLYDYVDHSTGRKSQLIDDKTYRIIMENKVSAHTIFAIFRTCPPANWSLCSHLCRARRQAASPLLVLLLPTCMRAHSFLPCHLCPLLSTCV